VKIIEISDETFDYLQEWLYCEGSEAWYTAQVEYDLKDYDGAIKSMANTIAFHRALMNDKLTYEKAFEEDIKVRKK